MTFVIVAPDQNLNNYPMNFGSYLSSTLATSQNNYAPAGINGGVNHLIWTPASGGSTVTGFASASFPNGWSIMIENPSATDFIVFPHLSASSASPNQFSCPQAQSFTLGLNSNCIITLSNSLVWKIILT